MIEGRFLSYYVQLQRDYLRDIDTYTTAESWATGLMERLIKITHRQWLYRNSTVHFKSKDGRTLAEHEKIKRKRKNAQNWNAIIHHHSKMVRAAYDLGKGRRNEL